MSPFGPAAEAARRRILSPWRFRAYLWWRLPLAACAGLRIESLDDGGCTVSLPGGWRTQNPFRSTYFAAQAMAAEMSTGAPALVLAQAAPASLSILVRGIRAEFTKKIVGRSFFTFSDLDGMAAALERAAGGSDAEAFLARSRGRAADGSAVAEFEIAWSFKRRG